MATTVKENLIPKLNLHWQGMNYTVEGRPISYQLRLELRKINRETNNEQVKSLASMPEGMLSDDPISRARAVQEVAREGEDKIDELLAATERNDESGDLVILRLAQCAINDKRISDDHQLLRELVCSPVVGEDGEPNEFWASQEWEVITEFVDRFRKAL